MGVSECVIMHPGTTLQIWRLQQIRLLQQELLRNSVQGAGLKASSTLTQFPRSFLEVVNLGHNIILYSSTLKYPKVLYLESSLSK